MKAIVVRAFGGPEVLKLEDVPNLTAGPGQLLLRIHAAGVNPFDTYIRTGTYAFKPNLPYTPGADAAGVVESVGAGVTRFRPGDRVYAHAVNGAYAELALCEEWQVHRLSQQLSFAQGAAVGVPYATARYALMQRAGARAGESVLVHGASGGVGTAAVQIARAAGLHVIGTAGSEAGIANVREQGAHEVLDHRQDGYLNQLMVLTGGRGVDVILEMLANVNLDRDLEVLAPRGRVVVIGSRGRIEIDPRKAMGKNSSILGISLANATREELQEIHSALVAGVENGDLQPVIAQELPLAAAAQAHVEVLKPGALGKIVLAP